ncbi:auxin-responsive protein SAUR78-like [Impatiens glandulifera]|uniref:auxin-responsive protein SAUR78-like n=1 Tax=Impatiens glandulifera TaxID=253017 RepID=UPI001FB16EA4|nr:auxin-responsive protein SAUR78-like [Impatiens glandulifera]
MGKGAKLTKLKSSVMKKWNSFSKLGRSLSDPSGNSTKISAAASSFSSSSDDSNILRTVYVGKSRRRYLVSSDVIDNPVIRELSSESDQDSDAAAAAVIVDCEVVLFEHLLWMLENAVESPPAESLHEFAQYYSCT